MGRYISIINNLMFFCYSPWKREFSDLFKTPQTFNKPITTTCCQAFRSSEILHFYTFFTFHENFWTSDSWQTLYNYRINKSFGWFENIKKFPLTLAITTKDMSLLIREIYRPKVGLFFTFVKKSQKKSLKKIYEIFFLQFF